MSRSLLALVVAFAFLAHSDGVLAEEKPAKKSTKKVVKPEENDDNDNEPPPTAKSKKSSDGFEIFGKSAILVDARTGRILFQKNPEEQRAAASTQKLLTALIVATSGSLTQEVVVQAADTQVEPTKIGIKAGETYTRIELLRALLVKSGNDTAVALARDNAGSVEAFAKKMNRKAFELGAYNSHFVNPNGLPNPGQYSCAHDLARIALAVYGNPVLRSIVTIRYLPFRHSDGEIDTLRNTNRVLHGYPYCNGMKTGYTDAAGHCLISSATENGRAVVSVVLGSNKAHVWNDSYTLLAYGLTQAAPPVPPQPQTAPTPVPTLAPPSLQQPPPISTQ